MVLLVALIGWHVRQLFNNIEFSGRLKPCGQQVINSCDNKKAIL